MLAQKTQETKPQSDGQFLGNNQNKKDSKPQFGVSPVKQQGNQSVQQKQIVGGDKTKESHDCWKFFSQFRMKNVLEMIDNPSNFIIAAKLNDLQSMNKFELQPTNNIFNNYQKSSECYHYLNFFLYGLQCFRGEKSAKGDKAFVQDKQHDQIDTFLNKGKEIWDEIRNDYPLPNGNNKNQQGQSKFDKYVFNLLNAIRIGTDPQKEIQNGYFKHNIINLTFNLAKYMDIQPFLIFEYVKDFLREQSYQQNQSALEFLSLMAGDIPISLYDSQYQIKLESISEDKDYIQFLRIQYNSVKGGIRIQQEVEDLDQRVNGFVSDLRRKVIVEIDNFKKIITEKLYDKLESAVSCYQNLDEKQKLLVNEQTNNSVYSQESHQLETLNFIDQTIILSGLVNTQVRILQSMQILTGYFSGPSFCQCKNQDADIYKTILQTFNKEQYQGIWFYMNKEKKTVNHTYQESFQKNVPILRYNCLMLALSIINPATINQFIYESYENGQDSINQYQEFVPGMFFFSEQQIKDLDIDKQQGTSTIHEVNIVRKLFKSLTSMFHRKKGKLFKNKKMKLIQNSQNHIEDQTQIIDYFYQQHEQHQFLQQLDKNKFGNLQLLQANIQTYSILYSSELKQINNNFQNDMEDQTIEIPKHQKAAEIIMECIKMNPKFVENFWENQQIHEYAEVDQNNDQICDSIHEFLEYLLIFDNSIVYPFLISLIGDQTCLNNYSNKVISYYQRTKMSLFNKELLENQELLEEPLQCDDFQQMFIFIQQEIVTLFNYNQNEGTQFTCVQSYYHPHKHNNAKKFTQIIEFLCALITADPQNVFFIERLFFAHNIVNNDNLDIEQSQLNIDNQNDKINDMLQEEPSEHWLSCKYQGIVLIQQIIDCFFLLLEQEYGAYSTLQSIVQSFKSMFQNQKTQKQLSFLLSIYPMMIFNSEAKLDSNVHPLLTHQGGKSITDDTDKLQFMTELFKFLKQIMISSVYPLDDFPFYSHQQQDIQKEFRDIVFLKRIQMIDLKYFHEEQYQENGRFGQFAQNRDLMDFVFEIYEQLSNSNEEQELFRSIQQSTFLQSFLNWGFNTCIEAITNCHIHQVFELKGEVFETMYIMLQYLIPNRNRVELNVPEESKDTKDYLTQLYLKCLCYQPSLIQNMILDTLQVVSTSDIQNLEQNPNMDLGIINAQLKGLIEKYDYMFNKTTQEIEQFKTELQFFKNQMFQGLQVIEIIINTCEYIRLLQQQQNNDILQQELLQINIVKFFFEILTSNVQQRVQQISNDPSQNFFKNPNFNAVKGVNKSSQLYNQNQLFLIDINFIQQITALTTFETQIMQQNFQLPAFLSDSSFYMQNNRNTGVRKIINEAQDFFELEIIEQEILETNFQDCMIFDNYVQNPNLRTSNKNLYKFNNISSQAYRILSKIIVYQSQIQEIQNCTPFFNCLSLLSISYSGQGSYGNYHSSYNKGMILKMFQIMQNQIASNLNFQDGQGLIKSISDFMITAIQLQPQYFDVIFKDYTDGSIIQSMFAQNLSKYISTQGYGGDIDTLNSLVKLTQLILKNSLKYPYPSKIIRDNLNYQVLLENIQNQSTVVDSNLIGPLSLEALRAYYKKFSTETSEYLQINEQMVQNNQISEMMLKQDFINGKVFLNKIQTRNILVFNNLIQNFVELVIQETANTQLNIKQDLGFLPNLLNFFKTQYNSSLYQFISDSGESYDFLKNMEIQFMSPQFWGQQPQQNANQYINVQPPVFDSEGINSSKDFVFSQYPIDTQNYLESEYYKISDINEQGYGNNYLFDLNEFISITKRHPFQFNKDFIKFSLYNISDINSRMSIVNSQSRLYDSWSDLLQLILTMGSQGYAMSTTINNNPQILMQSQLDMFLEGKYKKLFNPNHQKIHDYFGFIQICQGGKVTSCQDYDSIKDTFTFLIDLLCSLLRTAEQIFIVNNQKVNDQSEIYGNNMNEEFPDSSQNINNFNTEKLVKFNKIMNLSQSILNSIRYLLEYHEQVVNNHEYMSIQQSINNLISNSEAKLSAIQSIFNDIYLKVYSITQFDYVNLSICYMYFLSIIECKQKQLSTNINLLDFKNESIVNIYQVLLHAAVQTQSNPTPTLCCLNVILRLDPVNFIEELEQSSYRSGSQTIPLIDNLMKILFEYNSEQELQLFMTSAKLVLDIAKLPKGAQILYDHRFIKYACVTNRILDQINDINNNVQYYDISFQRKNVLQIVWCWTLAIYREFTLSISSKTQMLQESVKFLCAYQNRLQYVLNVPDKLYNQQRFSGKGQQNIIFNEETSLGYLDELEFSLGLLSAFYSYSDILYAVVPEIFEKYLFCVQVNTLKIFKITKWEHVFQPRLHIEEQLQEVLLQSDKQGNLDQGTNQFMSHIVGGTKNPMQATSYKSQFGTNKTQRAMIQDQQHLNTLRQQAKLPKSMYDLQLQIKMISILTYSQLIINPAIQYSQFSTLFEQFKISQQNTNISSAQDQIQQITYPSDFWRLISSNYTDMYNFVSGLLLQCQNKQFNPQHNLQTLDTLLKSVDYVCCTGQLSSLEEINDTQTQVENIIECLYLQLESGIQYLQIWKSYEVSNFTNKDENQELLRLEIKKALSVFKQAILDKKDQFDSPSFLQTFKPDEQIDFQEEIDINCIGQGEGNDTLKDLPFILEQQLSYI